MSALRWSRIRQWQHYYCIGMLFRILLFVRLEPDNNEEALSNYERHRDVHFSCSFRNLLQTLARSSSSSIDDGVSLDRKEFHHATRMVINFD